SETVSPPLPDKGKQKVTEVESKPILTLSREERELLQAMSHLEQKLYRKGRNQFVYRYAYRRWLEAMRRYHKEIAVTANALPSLTAGITSLAASLENPTAPVSDLSVLEKNVRPV